MKKINGNSNQVSYGDNSPNTKKKITKNNYLNNGSWFFSGFILPLIVGLLIEIIKEGALSVIFSNFISNFK